MKNDVTLVNQTQLQSKTNKAKWTTKITYKRKNKSMEIITWILEEMSTQSWLFFSSADFMNDHNHTSGEKRTHVNLHCWIRRSKHLCSVIKTQAGHCNSPFRDRHCCVEVMLLKQVHRELQLEYIQKLKLAQTVWN